MELNYFLDSSNYKKIIIRGNHYGEYFPQPYKSIIEVVREGFTFRVTEGRGEGLPKKFSIDGHDYNKNYVTKFLILCNAIKHTIIDYSDQYANSDFDEGEFELAIEFEDGELLEYKFKALLSDASEDLASALGYFVGDNQLPYGYKFTDDEGDYYDLDF